MTKIATVCVALVVSLPAYASAEDVRNGNWWNQQSLANKASYVLGMFDGTEVGRNFAMWGGVKNDRMEEWASKAADSYAKFIKDYFTNITNLQVVDGLDELYRDFKNRTILCSDGIWVVLRQINGASKDEIEELLQNLRKHVPR